MYQVTMDLETRLRELEQRRIGVVRHRDNLIAQAEAMIAEANEEFDQLALPLGREINELRSRLQRQDTETERQTTRRGRNSHKPPMLDGLDDEEQEHYKQLLARRKKR